ncbi:histidine--tRNA ligase [Limisalsivibrio acetivorans]|uniref:histidine--tRNA ligase n=1 Tax=Limisalsivibrio acetivorans TaxID=1304888 RepID=UPI0003B6B2AD|nr:histidine--tRNA ligase [Limisalsivibrio acetivorans]
MYRKVKGFRDIFGSEAAAWERVERAFRDTFHTFSFSEFVLPVLERTEVFNRGIGSTTDIVEKEMFAFEDRDGTQVALRPEGTASIVRAYVENKLFNPPEVKKYFYMGPMFRRERPQKGRFRQFFQAGVEVFGTSAPALDAEVIHLLDTLAVNAGIGDMVTMEINSIGCPACRPGYQEKLLNYLREHSSELCEDCVRRLDRNPMRILDCKNEKCKGVTSEAPVMLDHLCGDCVEHFDNVKEYLDDFGVEYSVNKMMVRGLDYYVRTAFEMVTTSLGSQNAVGAGGRYDGLVKLLGGPEIPGIGFALGIDRFVSLLMLKEEVEEQKADVFVIAFKDVSDRKAVQLLRWFREKGIKTLMDYDMRAMKKQMKKADQSGARFTLILGEDELEKGEVSVKDMHSGGQELVQIDKITDYISDKLG